MIQCLPLSSGSKGNAFLLQFDQNRYLIDLGISYRQLELRLKSLALTPGDIHGVFITHEHLDHISGLSVFLKKHPVPVFLTQGSAKALSDLALPSHLFFPFPQYCRYQLGSITVTVLPTSHDALEPCAFQFRHPKGILLHLTDTGEVPAHLARAVSECDILVIESNHDETLLHEGPYPAYLKKRILGAKGHLSNRQTGELIASNASSQLKHVVLAHLSEQNNRPELAFCQIRSTLEAESHRLDFSIHLSRPDQVGQAITID